MPHQVEEMEDELPPPQVSSKDKGADGIDGGIDGDADRPIATWTYCSNCKKVVSPLTYLSDTTWKYSFGKFLEVFFYNRDAIMNAPYSECSCQVQSSAHLYFGCGKLAARFGYEPIRPFGVYFCRFLPSDAAFQKSETLRRLDLISEESAKLFVKFDKHLERVSREARSLFNSPVNRPEHLQTVLSALNSIGSDVDETAKTLHDKITSAMESCRQQSDADSLNQALFQFPWSTRRFIFMLTSAWNERLSASGQAIVAMKKIAAASGRADGVIGQTVGDPLNDSLTECMKRLRKLNDQYARYKVSDITQVLPTLPGVPELQQDGDYDDEFDDPDTSIDFADGVDADVLASRRRLLSRTASTASSTASTPTRPLPTKSLGTRRREIPRPETVVTSTPKPTTGGAVKSAITRFFNRGGRDLDNYTVDLGVFAEGRPRLVPGVHGLVVPVGDEQLSSIIAYSLASVEYAKQFKYFSRNETTTTAEVDSVLASDRSVKDSTLGVETQRRGQPDQQASGVQSQQQAGRLLEGDSKDIERRMLGRSKAHIAHTYRDFDEKGQVTCKFKCTTYWATQFHAVRQVFLSRSSGKGEGTASDGSEPSEIEQSFVESLSSTAQWDASGGKSGASFSKSCDGRFVIKCISRTELQMFLDCAPAYFEYLSKAFFHGL
jgi:1-phosphatidylinositol-3-phosphate 5-kinase